MQTFSKRRSSFSSKNWNKDLKRFNLNGAFTGIIVQRITRTDVIRPVKTGEIRCSYWYLKSLADRNQN